jgi:hypothetical protein
MVLLEKEWNEYAFPFCSLAKTADNEYLMRVRLFRTLLLSHYSVLVGNFGPALFAIFRLLVANLQ